MTSVPDLRDPAAASAAAGLFRVPLEHIVLKPPVPCGMDFGEIGGKLKRYRTTREDEGPAKVRRRPGLPEPYWELSDGRHRFFAAVIAGRPDLLCEEER